MNLGAALLFPLLLVAQPDGPAARTASEPAARQCEKEQRVDRRAPDLVLINATRRDREFL